MNNITYKQKIIDIINNDDNKKLLSNLEWKGTFYKGLTIYDYLIRNYTEVCIEYPNRDDCRGLKELYYSISKIIKRNKIVNKFKKVYDFDIYDTLEFIYQYQLIYKCEYRAKVNKKLNENIKSNYKNLYLSLKGKIKEDYDFQINITKTVQGKYKDTFRKKNTNESLKKISKEYINNLKFCKLDHLDIYHLFDYNISLD